MILMDIDGIVHVAYIGYDQHIPRKNITLFATEVKTRDLEANYAPLSEISVANEHSYYRITRIGARYDQSLALYLAGKTNNRMLYVDIPCPKVRAGVKTRWNADKGSWEKELKSGWCTA